MAGDGGSMPLVRFDDDLVLLHDRLERCGIAEDFANDIDGTGRYDLAGLAHWCLAKENT
jgi:hypothetical protein